MSESVPVTQNLETDKKYGVIKWKLNTILVSMNILGLAFATYIYNKAYTPQAIDFVLVLLRLNFQQVLFVQNLIIANQNQYLSMHQILHFICYYLD